MEAFKNSSGINAFRSSLSSWAEDFIRSENVTSENFSQSESFHALTRSQKDAVRYQLKKRNPSKHLPTRAPALKAIKQLPSKSHTPKNWIQITGLALGVWISVFLMRDLVEFYQIKGLSFAWALQLALVVELALFFSSISGKRVLRACAYALLIYNAGIFILLQVTGAQNQQQQTRYRQEELNDSKQVILELEKEKAANLKRLDQLFVKGIVTSGTKAISELNSKLDAQIQEHRQWIEENSKNQHIRGSSPSITLGMLLMIVVRLILQLISIELFKSAGLCALGRGQRPQTIATGG